MLESGRTLAAADEADEAAEAGEAQEPEEAGAEEVALLCRQQLQISCSAGRGAHRAWSSRWKGRRSRGDTPSNTARLRYM